MIQKLLISAIALLVFFLFISEIIKSPDQPPKKDINVTPQKNLDTKPKIVAPKKSPSNVKPEIILEPNNEIKKSQPTIQKEKNIPFIIGIDVVPLSHTPLFYKIKEQGGFIITKIYKGTPASKSGLKVNDVILLVDNQKTYEMKSMLKSLIKGKRRIELKIWRGGERKYLNVTIY
jgi:S1-C subfamily serine protease